MKRRDFLTMTAMGAAVGTTGLPARAVSPKKPAPSAADDYRYFAGLLNKIAAPILALMANERFHKDFPIEVSRNTDGRDNRVVYLECFGRTIAGAAPWIAQTGPGDDASQRATLLEQAKQCYEHSVDPKSADYLDWETGHGQMLVDSAYYTQALLRAPVLWQSQSKKTKQRIVAAIKSLRKVSPPYTNWLLFAAMNEAFLMQVGEEHDPIRLDLTLRKFHEWYLGDGWFADGEHFAFDYYNSYVIQPMLLDILEVMQNHKTYYWEGDINAVYQQQLQRSQRYAEHLERLISPTGTYPPIGRSLTYRTAAFQPLSQLAHKGLLPDTLPAGRIRSALRAVHQAIFDNPSNFTDDGFLRIGFAGGNLALGDWYSNNGSMYITTASFVHLGLPATDKFWTAPAEDWTQKLAFSGRPFRKDYPVEY
ncbi:MAG: DUF2264 domain-containing protein [Cellvibrionaceae bacterium]|nr:DUF2264 domain-containing protein [Cellvibrionaceae bacterium]